MSQKVPTAQQTQLHGIKLPAAEQVFGYDDVIRVRVRIPITKHCGSHVSSTYCARHPKQAMKLAHKPAAEPTSDTTNSVTEPS
jgi:hypothetical protein